MKQKNISTKKYINPDYLMSFDYCLLDNSRLSYMDIISIEIQ